MGRAGTAHISSPRKICPQAVVSAVMVPCPMKASNREMGLNLRCETTTETQGRPRAWPSEKREKVVQGGGNSM